MMDKIHKMMMVVKNSLSKIPDSLIYLMARLGLAAIFWRSAMTKISFNEDGVDSFTLSELWNVITLDWSVGSNTYLLFEYEYDLPLLPFEWAANMAVAAELILPILLIFGFFTRYAALALCVMIGVIQIFVLPGSWPDHALWMAAALVLMAKGGGKMSVDDIFCRKCL